MNFTNKALASRPKLSSSYGSLASLGWYVNAFTVFGIPNSWSVNIDNGLINGVIFIDLKKAFDTIDHKILLQKLASYGIDHRALKWFDSYLSDRQQKCVVNGELSGAHAVTCGVPQGSLTGPLLFLIYSNDLPNCLS